MSCRVWRTTASVLSGRPRPRLRQPSPKMRKNCEEACQATPPRSDRTCAPWFSPVWCRHPHNRVTSAKRWSSELTATLSWMPLNEAVPVRAGGRTHPSTACRQREINPVAIDTCLFMPSQRLSAHVRLARNASSVFQWRAVHQPHPTCGPTEADRHAPTALANGAHDLLLSASPE